MDVTIDKKFLYSSKESKNDYGINKKRIDIP